MNLWSEGRRCLAPDGYFEYREALDRHPLKEALKIEACRTKGPLRERTFFFDSKQLTA